MKTLLMLTDFSITARRAAAYLSGFAAQVNAERIILYHSYRAALPNRLIVTDVLAGRSGNGAIRDAITQLTNIKAELVAVLGRSVTVDIIADDRYVLKAVDQLVNGENVDLVVLGICGAGDGGTNSVGRIPIALIEQQISSLLIVPSQAEIEPIKRVLLACDLKDIRERLPVEELKAFVMDMDARLTVVNVDKAYAAGAADTIQQQHALHQLLDGLQPEYHYLESDDIVGGLTAFSDRHGIDLLIAAPKPRGFLEDLFHRSATRKLAVKATKTFISIKKEKIICQQQTVPLRRKGKNLASWTGTLPCGYFLRWRWVWGSDILYLLRRASSIRFPAGRPTSPWR